MFILNFLTRFLIYNKSRGIALAGSVISMTIFMLALSRFYYDVFILIVRGIFMALYEKNEETISQEVVPEDYHSKIFLTLQSANNIVSLFSMGIARFMNDMIDVRSVFLFTAAFAGISSIIRWQKLVGYKECESH